MFKSRYLCWKLVTFSLENVIVEIHVISCVLLFASCLLSVAACINWPMSPATCSSYLLSPRYFLLSAASCLLVPVFCPARVSTRSASPARWTARRISPAQWFTRCAIQAHVKRMCPLPQDDAPSLSMP